jgi:hypothetical protein
VYVYVMKAIGGIRYRLYLRLLLWGEKLASRLGRFTTRQVAPGTRVIIGWVCPRVDLDVSEQIYFCFPCRFCFEAMHISIKVFGAWRFIFLYLDITLHGVTSQDTSPWCLRTVWFVIMGILSLTVKPSERDAGKCQSSARALMCASAWHLRHAY